MSQNYPEMRRELQKSIGRIARQVPDVMKSMGALHEAVYPDGALTTKHKELIALGIGIGIHCEGCIAFHTHEALAHGATVEEIVECISVAIQMGGGPAVVYAAHAMKALEQFTEAE